MNHKVYLVGGGPGALDLYTIKAMKCIQEADCVIYDRLIDVSILDHTKPGCECIYVGKAASNHTLPQAKINTLLIEKAKEHPSVVRLKGGDVYVFGRGGEEALALQEAGVSFEVVPGLSSAIAGLCYGGIPITHRGLSTGFVVITAHHQHKKENVHDFTQFLDNNLTYVFLMGLSKLEMIVTRLLAAGKEKDTPIALISNATLSNQKAMYGTLSTILTLFQQNPLPSPTIIVVGAVVSLHDKLHFIAQKKHYQQQIVVATITDEPLPITTYFQGEGAIVKQLQVGKIVYRDFVTDTNFENRIIVFTSRNGIRGFFRSLQKQKIDYRRLKNCRFACIGESTATELQKHGFYCDILSDVANSNSFNQTLEKTLLPQESLLIVGTTKTNIEKITAKDQYLLVYENQNIPVEKSNTIFDLACFTCASSVERLVKYNYQFNKAISIGPMTTKALQRHYPNIEILEAKTNNYEGMIAIIESIAN